MGTQRMEKLVRGQEVGWDLGGWGECGARQQRVGGRGGALVEHALWKKGKGC